MGNVILDSQSSLSTASSEPDTVARAGGSAAAPAAAGSRDIVAIFFSRESLPDVDVDVDVGAGVDADADALASAAGWVLAVLTALLGVAAVAVGAAVAVAVAVLLLLPLLVLLPIGRWFLRQLRLCLGLCLWMWPQQRQQPLLLLPLQKAAKWARPLARLLRDPASSRYLRTTW